MFVVKHCGKVKARFVPDGHLTKEANQTLYSGVVSLRNLRLVMFCAELNGLQLCRADVGNAYCQALTKEKSSLWLALNLKNHKDMFTLCTRHTVVEDLEEHGGMISILIFSTKWSSNPPKQTQIYG